MSTILGLLLLTTVVGSLEYLVFFVWLLILIIQIMFIGYWTSRLFGGSLFATVSTVVLMFVLICLMCYFEVER